MDRQHFFPSAFVLVLSLFVATEPARAQGGGGGGGSVPPGKIYFTWNGLTHSMNGDGSAKTALASGVGGEPSRLLHGGKRWFLRFDGVPGTYPDGGGRVELFAIRSDGAVSVQLTNQPDLEATGSARWSFTDSKVSFSAGRWVGSTLTDGGVHVLDIVFDGAGDVVGLAQPPASPAIPCPIFADSNGARPEIVSHDWAPDGISIVLAKDAGTAASRQLFIANLTLPGGGPVLLPTSVPAGVPSWSPTGTKIVFRAAQFAGSIYTINPSGTGESRIIKPQGSLDFLAHPSWSANGQHVVFQGGGSVLNDDRFDVYRVTATGSQKTNLTSSLDTHYLTGSPADPTGWR